MAISRQACLRDRAPYLIPRPPPTSRDAEPATLLTPTVLLSCLGAFLCSLDSALNVAFPALIKYFGLAPRHLALLIILYHIPIAIFTIVGGMAGDRFGHARLFLAGTLLCVAAFPLNGLAPSFGWLILGRVVQGAGAGLVFGTTPALITLGVRQELRGLGLAFLSGAAGVALAVAPVVAGLLISISNWRSVFLFRVPIALGLLGLALTYLPGTPRHMPDARARLVPPLSIALLAYDVATLLANAAFIVLYVLGPLYLADVLACSTTATGVLFMLVPLGTVLGGLVSGSSIRRLNPSVPVLVGLALEALGLALLGGVGAPPSRVQTALGFVVAGFGVGAFQVPTIATVMGLVPDKIQGFGGGMISTMRTLGIVLGATLAPWLLESRETIHRATGAISRGDTPYPVSAVFATAFGEVLLGATLVTLAALGLAVAGMGVRFRDKRTRVRYRL